MGCRAVLRYMFDVAKEKDEEAGNGECQTYQLAETIMNLNLLLGLVVTVGDDFISLPWW